jgi:glutamine synthetase
MAKRKIGPAYALLNPISLIIDKPREDWTRADLMKMIEEKQIERIAFHYTGLDGKLKELMLPITNRYQTDLILAEGERVDGSSLFQGLMDVALSDLYVVPVYKTAFLNPFDEGSLDFICRYLLHDGSFAPFALDNILRNAYELFRKNTNLEIRAMGELEFFLLSEPDRHIYPTPNQKGYHASAPYVKTGQILNEMVRHIAQVTGAVKYAHSEVGNVSQVRSNLEEIREKQANQLEIEFLPTPIEETGDNLVLARWLVRNTAYKYGCVATFVPKLEEGIAGNGLHMHMELIKDGKNVMTDEKGDLSREAKKMIGGLCNYADSLTAFGNTVSSAYLRLVPNQEAPTRICWSDQNRSAMIRVPLGWSRISNLASRLNSQEEEASQKLESRQTVELRSPDGSALVHLLAAGITMAAEWGLTNPDSLQIAEEHYVTGNVFQNQELLDKLPALPRSCVESSRILLEKRDLYEREDVFPDSIIEYVVGLLRAENDEKMNQVLVDLPADDRLSETRRIMHKDLHRH